MSKKQKKLKGIKNHARNPVCGRTDFLPQCEHPVSARKSLLCAQHDSQTKIKT